MKNFFRTTKKYFIVFAIILIAMFGYYIYKLHSIAVVGNEIQALRCTDVNPHLIAWRKNHNGFTNCLKTPGLCLDGEVKKYFDNDIAEMKKYADAEETWVDKENSFVHQFDVSYFMPQYLFDATEAQIKMVQEQSYQARQLSDGWEKKDEVKILAAGMLRESIDAYEKNYNDILEKNSKLKDWRIYFMNMPLSPKCNKENMTIPTMDSLI